MGRRRGHCSHFVTPSNLSERRAARCESTFVVEYNMFALVKNQTGRPEQPLAAVSAAELARCVASVNGRWQSSDVNLLTYLTDVGTGGPWVLGLSAAYHGQPLIVQGLGMRWGGVGIKLPAARRATQLLQALQPLARIVFADGSDTVVANPPHLFRREWPNAGSTMTMSSECGSFPLCYAERYRRHRAHQACRKRSSTCFPNSGVYTGYAEAILEVLPELNRLAATGTGVEHNEDQGAANRLYSSQNASSTSRESRLSVDGESQLFLSLYRCRGVGARADINGPTYIRRFGSFTLCNHGSHDPLQHVRVADGGAALFYNYSGRVTRPFIVHASGVHQRLVTAYKGRSWTDVFVPDRARAHAARSHPVLLLDSADHGLCHLTTLGALLPQRTLGRLPDSRNAGGASVLRPAS